MKVAVVDYGAGNLRSVVSALRTAGCDTAVVESPEDTRSARAMILPGVGAAADTMENLQCRGLADVVVRWIEAERPFLGICMGMQVLFTHSDEGDGQQCLGIIPGRVVRLPQGLKVPHMGWNQVRYAQESPLFRTIPDGSDFYFVHSYVAQPDDESIIAASTDYGQPFCSAVRRGALFATQFHPEKSGDLGLQLYRNFVEFAST
ncbi:MAG: imidazole glycerol phosphate synthase subunit HisH [Dehalococcoidia bacterium]|nr:imidazole glycerol phosphate synthase subunit HisH [Dehalococcoidia bacterium]